MYRYFIDNGEVFPLLSDDFGKSAEKEKGDFFFRWKLSGKLTFIGNDFSLIANSDFEKKFDFKITKNNVTDFTGYFTKADCTINYDSNKVEVTPEPSDEYTEILKNLSKKFDVLELSPAVTEVTYTRRPLIQIYVDGDTVITNYQGSNWWEQQCTAELDGDKLVNTHKFFKSEQYERIDDGDYSYDIAGLYNEGVKADNKYKFRFTTSAGQYNDKSKWQLIRVSDNEVLYETPDRIPVSQNPDQKYNVYVSVSNPNESFTFKKGVSVYTRYLTDKKVTNSVDYPRQDIAGNNQNYRYVVPLNISGFVIPFAGATNTPTRWGKYPDSSKNRGMYYEKYSRGPAGDTTYPIGKSQWGEYSLWLVDSPQLRTIELGSSSTHTIRDCYKLVDVIKVLLIKVDPSITHEETEEYSKFLYGTWSRNMGGHPPVTTTVNHNIIITPKTNLIFGNYDRPAEEAELSLEDVFKMLLVSKKCGWMIRGGKLIIEHVSYFLNGGSHTAPTVSYDMTSVVNRRSGLNYQTNEISYVKDELPGQITFSWMDKATKVFNGSPIDVNSIYADNGVIEENNISLFSSDIDYMIANPESISQDGFVVFDCDSYIPIATPITSSSFKQGGINLTNGTVIANVPRSVYTDLKPIEESSIFSVSIDSKYVVSVIEYDAFGAFLKTTQRKGSFTLKILDNTFFIRLVIQFGWTAQYPIQPSMVAGTGFSYRVLPVYKVPVTELNTGWFKSVLTQNYRMSFTYIEKLYYLDDLPANNCTVDGTRLNGKMKKIKVQNVEFPITSNIDLVGLVKTDVGNGQIDELEYNYDTFVAKVKLLHENN